MTNRVTILLEKAINSNSDPERLACLNQAAKIYRGEGVTMPRRVVRPEPKEVATQTPMIAVAEHQAKMDEVERDRVRLLKDNATLSAENTQLRSDKLAAATAKDDAIFEDVKKKIRRVAVFGAVGWLAAFAAFVVLGMIVI